MHFKKEGQKIRAWVDPPSPIIRAMPERKRFFSLMSSLKEEEGHNTDTIFIMFAKWMVFIQLSDHDGFESHYDDGDNVCNMDGFSVMHLNLSAHCGLC